MTSRCLVCENALPAGRERYCSARCYGRARRKGLPATTPLAQFMATQLHERRITQGALARSIGISRASMTRYLQGRAPTGPAYERLRLFFGEDLPHVPTETDRRRAAALANLEVIKSMGPEGRAEAQVRAKLARRGRPKPGQRDAMRRSWARRKARGEAPDGSHLTSVVQSPKGRLSVSLGKYLGTTPRPARDDLHKWADRTAARHGLTKEAVLSMWRPMLHARGLQHLAHDGPVPDERRHEIIVNLDRGWSRTPGGVRRPGFWKQAARQVTEVEGERVTDVALERWWQRHEPTCPASADSHYLRRQQLVQRRALDRRRETEGG